MNELQAQLDEVTAQIAEEQAKGPQKDADVLAGLEQKQQVILMNMDEAKTQEEQENAKQVRIQAQEEKVDSIVLPYDFNDLFSDDDYKNAQGQPHKVSKANSMIIELVKEFQRKAYEDHNAEVQALTDELRSAKEEVRAAGERELQLKRQNDELQACAEQWAKGFADKANEVISKDAQIAQLQLDKKDADDKRDAAVKQLEEAQAEITQLKGWNDDLRAQAAQGVRKAIDIIDISPTDKLAQMVKETNEQKAERALKRWSEIMPEVVAPPVASAGPAVFPVSDPQTNDPSAELVGSENIVVPEESPVEHFRNEEIQAVSAPLDGNTTVPKGDAETVSRDEINIIHARLDRLEKQANLPELQVAV